MPNTMVKYDFEEEVSDGRYEQFIYVGGPLSEVPRYEAYIVFDAFFARWCISERLVWVLFNHRSKPAAWW